MFECIFPSFPSTAKTLLVYTAIQSVAYQPLSTYNIEFMQQGEHSEEVTGC